MPGDPKHPGKPNRPIHSDLKSKKIVWEPEKPIRWSFMKILREYSTLKEFYPEINPYVEAYKVRDNTWALYSESMDGAGDPWMYVIEGPAKTLVIDTAFGVGDLKGLVEKLVPNKPIVVANTHHHFDHAYGNAQFDVAYCHEDEEFSIRSTMNPHIWDYLYDHETMKGIYTEFDPKDIIAYKDYELIPLKTNECIDLGEGYLVECIPLRGHTAGQAGWLDKQTGCFFVGDITGVGRPKEGEPKPENLTVERLRDDVAYAVDRMDEYSGIFSGHGPLDQTPIVMKYELDALNHIVADPKNADEVKTMHFHGDGATVTQYVKYIQQGTAIKYGLNQIYYKDAK